jgi:thiamine biosynthesis lipoprotein
LTGGAFDVTVRPLIQLWKQAAKTGQPPTAKQIKDTLARCGMKHLSLSGKRLTWTRPGAALDFGGIVKGMAVDEAIGMLRSANVRAALVQIGGETGAFGLSARNMPHVIGIQHPLDLDGLWTRVADPGSGLSISTSGNYRNPVRIGKRTYYHIVDPRTGQPVDTQVLSVSVLFPRTGQNGLADGLSTAGAVLGPEKTLDLVAQQGGQALVILRRPDGDVASYKTPGFGALVSP